MIDLESVVANLINHLGVQIIIVLSQIQKMFKNCLNFVADFCKTVVQKNKNLIFLEIVVSVCY